MQERNARRLQWLVAALGALALAIAFDLAPRLADATLVYVGVAIVELCLSAVCIFAVGRPSDGWERSLHSRARWRVLSVIRWLAVVPLVVLLCAGLWLIVTEGPATPSLASTSPWFAGVTLACILGACAEAGVRSGATRAAPPRSAVYTAGGKRVYARGKDVFAESSGQTLDIGEVERLVDARSFQERRAPTPTELRNALERWGRFEGDSR